MINKTKTITTIITFLLLFSPLFAADWLQQGGPNGNGVVSAETSGKLATSFPDKKPPLLWKTSIGLGTAPVVVSDGKVYAFGLYKAGTPPDKLADPGSMPDGRLMNGMWHRGVTTKAIKALQAAKIIPDPENKSVDIWAGLSRQSKDWPDFVKNLKDPATGKDLPAYLTEGITPIKEIPGVPAWVSKLSTLPDYQSWPPFRGDEYAQCLDAATGRVIWATKLSDSGIAGSNIGWSAASPTIVEGKILFHSSNGHLYCLKQSDGKLLWDANFWDHEMFFPYTTASGLLIFKDTAIVSYPSLPDAVPLDDVISGKIPMWKVYHEMIVAVAGFDLQTGKFKWICKPGGPLEIPGAMRGYSVQCPGLGYAVIEGNPTVLVRQGIGNYGVDPATGTKRWEFNLEVKTDEAHPRGLWAPYGSYAPVAWKDFVVDSISVGHDDWCSQTYCIQITNNTPKLVWTTDQFVPYIEFPKSNLIAGDGKVYGFDAHGIWGGEHEQLKQGGKKDNTPGRPLRPEGIGRFQCRDVATGNLLWSSDAIPTHGKNRGVGEWHVTHSLLADDLLVACGDSKFDIAKLKGNNLELLATVEQTKPWNDWTRSGADRDYSDPVLVDGLLYIHPQATYEENLSCYDLRPQSGNDNTAGK